MCDSDCDLFDHEHYSQSIHIAYMRSVPLAESRGISLSAMSVFDLRTSRLRVPNRRQSERLSQRLLAVVLTCMVPSMSSHADSRL